MKEYTCVYTCDDGETIIEPIEAENKAEARYIMQGMYPMLIKRKHEIYCKQIHKNKEKTL